MNATVAIAEVYGISGGVGNSINACFSFVEILREISLPFGWNAECLFNGRNAHAKLNWLMKLDICMGTRKSLTAKIGMLIWLKIPPKQAIDSPAIDFAGG